MVEFSDIKNTLQLHGVSDEKLQEVKKAYDVAEWIHQGQLRKSGEPYIIHPLHVAQIILDMEIYDPDMISAALLHDTIEDSDKITKEGIARLINPEVAELVDGVTKLKKYNYSSNIASVADANILKILEGFRKDVRIILIKLADRLHNMRTLEYMKRSQQIAKSQETMDLYVPLAITIGAYRTKSELEDLALKYLKPEIYDKIVVGMDELYLSKKEYLENIVSTVNSTLLSIDISNEIIIRNKSVSNVYDAIKIGYELENIYDLYYLKILVPSSPYERNCYTTLGMIHSMFPALPGRQKDYISNPRSSSYQSIHTTVSDKEGNFLKFKIRTFEMDKVAAFGFPAIWNLNNGLREKNQREIVEKSQIVKLLIDRDNTNISNSEFVKKVRQGGLNQHIYVYDSYGTNIELSAGATAIDYVCQEHPDMLDKMTGVLVDGKEVRLDTELKNDNRVQIITKGKINRENWENYASYTTSKQKIKKMYESEKKN